MDTIVQSKSAQDVKIKRKVSLYKGFCSVDQYELEQRRFDGTWTPAYNREVIAKCNAVGALPYDPKIDCVVLIEQLRICTLGINTTPWLIEIVAGVMDKEHEESNEDLITREMQEEAGLKVEALIPMYNYFSTPGYSTEKVKLFCAKVDATKAPIFCGLKEEHEDIKIHVISTQEAFAAIRSGQINNAASIIALQWLELNLPGVHKQWESL